MRDSWPVRVLVFVLDRGFEYLALIGAVCLAIGTGIPTLTTTSNVTKWHAWLVVAFVLGLAFTLVGGWGISQQREGALALTRRVHDLEDSLDRSQQAYYAVFRGYLQHVAKQLAFEHTERITLYLWDASASAFVMLGRYF